MVFVAPAATNTPGGQTGCCSCCCHQSWHMLWLGAGVLPGCQAGHSPGCFDTFASLLLCVNMFISDDLPTFDLPMTANSGKDCGGQPFRSTLLLMYTAFLIFANSEGGRVSCCVWIASLFTGVSFFADAEELPPAVARQVQLHVILRDCALGTPTGCQAAAYLPDVDASRPDSCRCSACIREGSEVC